MSAFDEWYNRQADVNKSFDRLLDELDRLRANSEKMRLALRVISAVAANTTASTSFASLMEIMNVADKALVQDTP